MFETDKNMLKAIEQLKASGVIPFRIHAYEVMNLDTRRIYKIKNPDKHKQAFHFTAEHIRLFCKHFGINVNYIFGLEKNMYLK